MMNTSVVSSTKRIAFLHQHFPFGGGEQVSIRLAEAFKPYGIKTYIFCNRLHKEKIEEPCSYEIKVMPREDSWGSDDNIAFLTKEIDKNQIEILFLVHGFSQKFGLIRQKTGVRFIFPLHNIPSWEKTALLDLSNKPLGKQLWTLIGKWSKEILFQYYTKRWSRYYRMGYDNCDLTVTLHPEYTNTIRKKLQIDGKKIICIPNMYASNPPSEPNPSKKILFCGRMTFLDKRPDRMLQIWNRIYKQLPDWKLIMLGDGPELPRLKQYVLKQKLERVEFSGWCNNPVCFYQQASIICSTSTFESFGLSILEGIAHGCVPLAFNCSSGLASIIGNPSLLIPPFNQKLFGQKLIELATNESLRREEYTQAACNIQQFIPEKIIPQWLQAFEKLNK